MHETLFKSRNGRANGTAFAGQDAGYALKVALVYQDVLTQQWAEQLRERVAEVVGHEAIHSTGWRIGDLKEARTFSEGVAALAKADVIVISLYEAERLPAIFYLWVNVWLQQRSGFSGALVALVVRPDESHCGANETQRYLYAVASQGHLEFLIQEASHPGEPIRMLREDVLHWAKAA
jgi:hypothetical protein